MGKEIHTLIERYEAERKYFLTDRYNESQLRQDFLNPFFELLGWDIVNVKGLSTNEREVIVEEPLKAEISENAKKPDYTFRLFNQRKFFLEAKKPCVHIENTDAPAKQVRRYGYTANLKISVLSNFEYLFIYDTSVKVTENDSTMKALIKKYSYTEYEERFDEIKRLIGRDAVYNGLFDKEWKHIETNQDKWSVDKDFLEQINGWRLLLGNEIYNADKQINIERLNDEVQSYIDKVLCLRICEDRNIEEYKTLLNIADNGNFDMLLDKFKEADKKYNSGLFEHELSDKVVCNAKSAFWTMIHQLYFPESSYSFSVFSSDIIGHIYEIFISQKLAFVGGGMMIVDKPDNVDRDVITTPTFIVYEILRQTVLPLCTGKNDKELMQLKISDIACGSGAFLTEAYQLLADQLTDYYIANDKSKLVQIGTNNYKLKFSIKKRLLKNCIYGVDKDFNAVEACKFGLLLKLLEDENVNTLLEAHPILPDLSGNIFFGNSLLSNADVSDDNADAINPFDFDNLEFDAIIGNPPYMKSEDMKNITPLELPLYERKYTSSYRQFDKYMIFIERAYGLLKQNGILGYIVPNKFMKVGAGEAIRKMITDNKCLLSITSFGANQVFADKSTYTCLIVLTKKEQDYFSYNEVENLDKWKVQDKNNIATDIKQISMLNENTWCLFPDSFSEAYQKILSQSVPLTDIVDAENIFNGIQTSANDIYVFIPKAKDSECYTFVKKGIEYKVEKQVTKPYFMTPPKSKDDGLSTYRTFMPNARVIFPYKKKNNSKLDIIPIHEIKEKYPYLYRYLSENKERLGKRDIKPTPKTNEEWYRYGRHQSLESCNLPRKIIVGVLSMGDKYALDTHSTFVSSGGTAGYCIIGMPASCQYSVYYLLAILNSKYLEWISSLYGEIFRGGYIARGTKVLKQLPVREIDFNNVEDKQQHDFITNLQKKLIRLGDNTDSVRGDRRKYTIAMRLLEKAKLEMSAAIIKLYGMEKLDEIVPSIKKQYATDK